MRARVPLAGAVDWVCQGATACPLRRQSVRLPGTTQPTSSEATAHETESFGVALEPGERFFDFLPGTIRRVTGFRGGHQVESFAQGIDGFAIAVILW